MKTYTEIQLHEFDQLLKSSSGWERNRSGYEYVYDYNLKRFPHIMIKVLSSINVDNGISRNKGSDAIRVFAVRVDAQNKVIGGYLKQIRVYRTRNWRDNVRAAFMKHRTTIYNRMGK